MYNDVAISEISKIIMQEAAKRAKGKGQHTFQAGPLLNLIERSSSFAPTDIRHALKEIFKNEWISGKHSDHPFRMSGRITVAVPKQDLPNHEQIWLDLLEESSLTDSAKNVLQKVGPKLQGLNKEKQAQLLAGLIKLRAEQKQVVGEHLYDISAKYLLASSKLLSCIQKEAMAFGINVNSFSPAYRYICIAGNKNPAAVVIVENPHSFESAVRADKDLKHTWISSYGFGITLDKGYKYGELLEKNLSSKLRETIPLTRAGSPDALETLLRHPNLFFWGDLDVGGLKIFQNLKKRFPQLKMSPLYNLMAQELKAGNGHPYVKTVGKKGQDKLTINDDEPLQYWIELCSRTGVDQEVVPVDLIASSISMK